MFLGNANAQHSRPSRKYRPGNIQVALSFIGGNAFEIALFIAFWRVDLYQASRDTFGKCVCQYLTFFDYKKICQGRVAHQMVVQQGAQCNQIIY